MTCSNCGHSFADGPGFCTVCGARVGWPGADNVPMTPPVPPAPPTRQAAPAPTTKACPYCAEQILQAAIKCRFCGSDLTAARQPHAPPIVIQNIQPPTPVYVRYPFKNPGVAMLLSIFFPGGGQFYNGDPAKGILILLTFWLFVPWIYGIVDAYTSANRINRCGY